MGEKSDSVTLRTSSGPGVEGAAWIVCPFGRDMKRVAPGTPVRSAVKGASDECAPDDT